MDTAQIERLLGEDILTAAQAAGLFPTATGAMRPSTVVRWITHGRGGIHLEGCRHPGRGWLTSRQAVVRFLARLTGQALEEAHAPTPAQTERNIQERVARARAQRQQILRGK